MPSDLQAKALHLVELQIHTILPALAAEMMAHRFEGFPAPCREPVARLLHWIEVRACLVGDRDVLTRFYLRTPLFRQMQSVRQDYSRWVEIGGGGSLAIQRRNEIVDRLSGKIETLSRYAGIRQIVIAGRYREAFVEQDVELLQTVRTLGLKSLAEVIDGVLSDIFGHPSRHHEPADVHDPISARTSSP